MNLSGGYPFPCTPPCWALWGSSGCEPFLAPQTASLSSWLSSHYVFPGNSASGKGQRCWLHWNKQLRLSVVNLALHSARDENIFFMQAAVLRRSPLYEGWGQSSALHIRWIPDTSVRNHALLWWVSTIFCSSSKFLPFLVHTQPGERHHRPQE